MELIEPTFNQYNHEINREIKCYLSSETVTEYIKTELWITLRILLILKL